MYYCMQTVVILLCVTVVLCYSAPPPPRSGYKEEESRRGHKEEPRRGYKEEHRNDRNYDSRSGPAQNRRGPLHYPTPIEDREEYNSRSNSYAPNRIEEGGYNKGRTYGRTMEYTMDGPNQTGKMKVTETHVQMDRRMNGQEAEQAMKKIMGSMKSDAKSDFSDFVKDLGFENFGRY